MSSLFDFAVITIFAREFLEGSIILCEYRTIIKRGGPALLEDGVTEAHALRAIHTAAWVAVALALLVIAAIAIPLSVLSRNFDDKTSKIIEGVSKMVAGICLLQLSLKLPKFLGVYGSTKPKKKAPTKSKKKAPIKAKETGSTVSRSNSDGTTDADTKTQVGDMSGVHTQVTSSSTLNEDFSLQTPTPVLEHVVTADLEDEYSEKLSLRNMRFNVAWNIWREGR